MRRDAERMTDRHRTLGRHWERSEAIQGREAISGLLRRCAPRNDGLVMALLLGMVAAPCVAAPRSIADCEKIQEADAYNRCLASFGPMRGQHGATYPGVASEGDRGDSGRSAYRTRQRYGGAQVSYGRGGRIRMEFTPGRR